MKVYMCLATAAVVAIMSGGVWARSSERKPSVDPQARQLLAQMTDAYRSLRSYAARVEITAGSGTDVNSSLSSVSYKKPDLAFVYTKSPSGVFKTVCDGKTIYVTKPGDKKEYEEMTGAGDTAKIALAIRTGGASITGLFPFVATGNDPYALLTHNLKSLSVLSPDTIAGVQVDVVQAVEGAPGLKDATMTIAIGHDDHLLRRVGFLSGDGRAIIETISDVKVNPDLSDSMFHFTPPHGAKALAISPSQS